MRVTISRLAITVAILATATTAGAAVVTVSAGGASFFDKPYTYDFGGGNTVTFTTVDKTFFALAPAGVSTAGTTQIGSFGAPFYDPPRPTAYAYNRGQSFGPGANLPLFLPYASPAAVDYSIVRELVGLRFDLGEGYQYGYADIGGSTVYGFRYETTPGADVPFGAVPEPTSWAMLITGFAVVGGGLRVRRRGLATA